MISIAIEFHSGVDNTDKKGFIRLPNSMENINWSLGFRRYVKEKYKVEGVVKIYPHKTRITPDDMGNPPEGFIMMEDDFNEAVNSLEYYPESESNNAIRRSWGTRDLIGWDRSDHY